MDRLDIFQETLPSWAQKLIVSVFLVFVIQLVLLPRLRREKFRDGYSDDFGGSGQALDKDWSTNKNSRQNVGGAKSRLVSEYQLSATRTNAESEEYSEDEEVLSEESMPSQIQNETGFESPAVRNDVVTMRKESKPLTKKGRRSQSRTEPKPLTERVRPKLKSKAEHPGLGAFNAWHSAISDIYRSYTVGKTDGSTPALPIIPRSERGNVPVHLEVTNSTSEPFDVFWVDYKGNEEYKGSAAPGSSWHQQTWIGHPWTFRAANGGKILLHYVPFRVIQTTASATTVTARNEGIQRFTILPPSYDGDTFICDVDDPILPFPSTKFTSPQKAFDWSCSHMEREGSSPRTVIKYLRNVLENPDVPKYRQIRTANRAFWNGVWITAARGMLHALGFEENGAYVEMGPDVGALPVERVKQVSDAISALEALLLELEGPDSSMIRDQPAGADGFGRAGFGRIGIN